MFITEVIVYHHQAMIIVHMNLIYFQLLKLHYHDLIIFYFIM